MRFTCEKSMLAAGLNIAGRTVAAKSSLSVIEGILCRAASVGISLTGYNMETAITHQFEADVEEDGECILPAKLFGDIIRRMPEGPVTVVVDDDTYKTSIRSGFSSFTISAENADDYPILPDVSTGKAVRIPQAAMKELIGGTIFAVSENQGRPIHTGVKFEVEDDSVSAIAVDGFRLARRTFRPEEPIARKLSFVVPASGLKEVEKLLADEGDVAFTLGNKHILFQMGATTLVCRLLEGDFLDWRRVVPTDCPIKLAAHVSDLSASIDRVGLIVSEKYKSPVRCRFGRNEVIMKTNTTIGSAEDHCSYAGDGGELEIGFNVRYLSEALRAVPGEEVIVELTDGLSPIVFTPVDEKHDFAYMVLPVRIKNA